MPMWETWLYVSYLWPKLLCGVSYKLRGVAQTLWNIPPLREGSPEEGLVDEHARPHINLMLGSNCLCISCRIEIFFYYFKICVAICDTTR